LGGLVFGQGGTKRAALPWQQRTISSSRTIIPVSRCTQDNRGVTLRKRAVSEAGDIDEVTALLQDDADVDLVLLDLNMPGVRGFSGLMYLRAQYPGVPVCIVSATEDHAIIRRALDFGAAGFMPKSLPVAMTSQPASSHSGRRHLDAGRHGPVQCAR
jgi:DNA-binding NarL/FixJ family response regulator